MINEATAISDDEFRAKLWPGLQEDEQPFILELTAWGSLMTIGLPLHACDEVDRLVAALAFIMPNPNEAAQQREAARLGKLACAVADAWAPIMRQWHEFQRWDADRFLKENGKADARPPITTYWNSKDPHELSASLDALELATRESPLRKVKP